MKTLLLISVLTTIAASSQLPFIARPADCTQSSDVVIEATYEKQFCYLNWNVLPFEAKKRCEERGMQLYVHDSSWASRAKLYAFGRVILKRDFEAQVYISGRKGRRCLTYLPSRRYAYIDCQIPQTFICEYPEIITDYPICDSHDKNDIGTFFSVGQGAGDPLTCVYKQPVIDSRTVLSAKAPVVKENIIILDVENVPDSDYIPINLAAQFPNLEQIKAEACSIRGLAKATLAGLTKIRFIDLDYNQIRTLTADLFQGLTTLERIDMDQNPIVRLGATNIFEGLSAMYTVFLNQANCISYVVTNSPTTPDVPGTTANTCEIVN